MLRVLSEISTIIVNENNPLSPEANTSGTRDHFCEIHVDYSVQHAAIVEQT